MSETKLDFPAFHRNIDPIEELLGELFSSDRLSILEIGSGSGQHVARLARQFPNCRFQPTDIVPENLASIDAWVKDAEVSNVGAAIRLDIAENPWPLQAPEQFDVIMAFNVIHIAPWHITRSLFEGAARHAKNGTRVLLYGPFKINGQHTSESNSQFELWLQEKSDAYGIRDIAEVDELAMKNGFKRARHHPMPANNFMMEFVRVD